MIADLRAVLCDADGNLFPSEEPAFVASADVTDDYLAQLGVPARFTAEQLRLATTGKNFRTTAVDLAVEHGVTVEATVMGVRTGAAVSPAPRLTAALLEHWVEQERLRVTEHLARELRPDPTVLEPLARLAARYLLAGVSSSATPRLTACFRATGVDALIPSERLFSAEDSLPVPTSKPDPAVYLHACRELGIDPAQAVAVEDSVPGAQSAVAAGIATIGNLQFVQPAEREQRDEQLRDTGVVAVVTSWAEVERLVQEPPS
jgi:HAD superfamily hydrolase (TIGR01509 family)